MDIAFDKKVPKVVMTPSKNIKETEVGGGGKETIVSFY